MRVAGCQMNSRQDKAANLAAALGLLDRASAAGADLAVLPEYIDYLGTNKGALAATEPVPGPLTEAIGAWARALGLWVLSGSLHARTPDGRCTNASPCCSTARAGSPRAMTSCTCLISALRVSRATRNPPRPTAEVRW